MAQRAGAGLLQVAELGLGQLVLLDLAEGELDRVVAVAVGVRIAVTGQGPASTTVTGTTVPSSRKTWVMPSFLPMIAATST